MIKERDLMHHIIKRLELYQMTGEVEWFSRLQCGKIKHFGNWIKLCDKGTPDFLALIRGRLGLMALFIEAKSDIGIIRKDQVEFMKKHTKDDICVLIVRDVSDLDKWVEKYAKDFVSTIG